MPIHIKYKPYGGFDEEFKEDSELETVVSGYDHNEALHNLVQAINNDEIDDINNELIIIEEDE